MRRPHLIAGGDLQPRLQLSEVQIGPGFQQTPNRLEINPHLKPGLVRLALGQTGPLASTGNLPRPRQVYTELIRQSRQRALAKIVSLEQLPTKIVARRSSHPSRLS